MTTPDPLRLTPDYREQVAAVLERAAVRLEQPGRWTQRKVARDFAGRETEPAHPSAVCWCMLGAVDLERRGTSVDYDDTCRALGSDQKAIVFNDAVGRTQAQIVARLRRAAGRVRNHTRRSRW